VAGPGETGPCTQYHPGVRPADSNAFHDPDAGTHPAKRHPVARRVVRQWRLLTGGSEVRDADRPTLVACSAGVDSSALAIALARVSPRPVVGHVVHDFRERSQVTSDRDTARALADHLRLPFVEREAPVRALGGNLEAQARRARYAALAQMAAEHGCRYIATAHHADDQLETVLMRLIRGSGPRGLGGVMPTRRLNTPSGPVLVVRPMLTSPRSDAVRLCQDAGWAWREDASNRDESFLRNAIRARVIPEIKAIRPDAAERAAVTAEVCRASADAIERQARLVLNRATRDLDGAGGPTELDRRQLAAPPLAVRCEVLRMLLRDAGGRGLDRAGWSVLEPAAAAIGDARMEPRTFRVGSIVIAVRAHTVAISEAEPLS
jgi:tRNA(Ile)-lysidine synthase